MPVEKRSRTDIEKVKKAQNRMRVSYGGVAQLGEHLPCKQGVRGSNPLTSTRNARKDGPIAQLARACA